MLKVQKAFFAILTSDISKTCYSNSVTKFVFSAPKFFENTHIKSRVIIALLET